MRLVSKLVLASALCVSCSMAMAADNTDAQQKTVNGVPTIDLQHFSAALQAAQQVYVDKVDNHTLFNNAISGMMSGLDPHSSFLDEDDYKALQDMTNGSFGGIGIEVLPTNGLIQVLTPLDDTPAYKAGIKPGDYIVRINGKSVQGMGLDAAIKTMRGQAGTEVSIVVLRKNEAKPLSFTMKRELIKLQSVKSKLLDGDYGYIRIVDFESTTGKDVSNAVAQLQKESKKPLKGIIIDLRNNPGGLLEAAVDVSNVFLDVNKAKYQKKVVYTKGRIPDMNVSEYVTGHDQTHGIPIVVLINGSTASAAEIVAGALQDQDRAVIVGTRSFGKGSVQTLIPLPPDDKTAIKLTTALYYTPSGRSIQAEGIVPDVNVPQLVIPKTIKPDEDILGTESQLIGHLANPVAPVQTISVKPVTGSKTSAPNTNANKADANAEDAKEQDQALMGKVFDTDKDKSKEQVPLMYRDYQLYEALLILKSLSYSQTIGIAS